MLNTALAPSGLGSRLQQRMRSIRRALRGNPNMLFGLVLVLFVSFIAIFASYLDKEEGPGNINPFVRLQAPDNEHWFGTDLMGRDVYSRSLHGSRLSLAVGATVAVIVMAAGAFVGVPTGYFKLLDNIIMRFMDGLMAFPSFLLAIALVAILGPSFQNVVIALSVTGMPPIVRIVRGSVLSLKEAQYVEAAKALGADDRRVLRVHIFPQIVAPLVVGGTFIFASSILTEAGLSFLGTGIPPITPSWGNMMGESKIYANISVWTLFFPGLMIAITVLGINLVGDGLRDALDPKLRRRQ